MDKKPMFLQGHSGITFAQIEQIEKILNSKYSDLLGVHFVVLPPVVHLANHVSVWTWVLRWLYRHLQGVKRA